MKELKYNLDLKTSIKGGVAFAVGLYVFFDMKKSYLLTHDRNDPGVWLINLGILVCFLFILICVYSVFSRFFCHKNHRIVFKENMLIIPGFLRVFKEIEINYLDIVAIEKIDNRAIQIIVIQLSHGKKYEFFSTLFDGSDDFKTFYEVLKRKKESLEG